ncbi:hypothetical protein PROFUN_00921 [Planoprotostelium fungivorum]|uniref:Carboxylesterase type B domain-containing protein n=1 Tax=Planoprotostelium fungivorum TaxID=1890364 RepID=A0A2P6P0E3_9EUKA|nr:hypothetical protein PROFUN_00921 [Planoprotostelium fungivorum]
MEKFWWHLGKSSNHYCSRACEVFIDAIQESIADIRAWPIVKCIGTSYAQKGNQNIFRACYTVTPERLALEVLKAMDAAIVIRRSTEGTYSVVFTMAVTGVSTKTNINSESTITAKFQRIVVLDQTYVVVILKQTKEENQIVPLLNHGDCPLNDIIGLTLGIDCLYLQLASNVILLISPIAHTPQMWGPGVVTCYAVNPNTARTCGVAPPLARGNTSGAQDDDAPLPEDLTAELNRSRTELIRAATLSDETLDPTTQRSSFSMDTGSDATLFVETKRITPELFLNITIVRRGQTNKRPQPVTDKRGVVAQSYKKHRWETLLEDILLFVSENVQYASTTKLQIPDEFFANSPIIFCYIHHGSFLPSRSADGFQWKSSFCAPSQGHLQKREDYKLRNAMEEIDKEFDMGALRGEVPYQEIEESTHVLSYVSGILNNWASSHRTSLLSLSHGLFDIFTHTQRCGPSLRLVAIFGVPLLSHFTKCRFASWSNKKKMALKGTAQNGSKKNQKDSVCVARFKLWKEIGEQHHFNVRAITRAISNVHPEIVEMLLCHPKVDLLANDNSIFRRACRSLSHVGPEMNSQVKAILEFAKNNEAILRACNSQKRFNHIKILLEDPRVDPSVDNNEALRAAAERGNLSIPTCGPILSAYPDIALSLGLPSAESSAQLFNVTINGNNTFVGQKNVTLPDVIQYLNIPFARPPLGPLRFRPPVPLNVTNTLTVCNNTQPACVQPDGSGQEDCLYLAVFVPATANASSNLPVRIFIHGGAFISASYDSISGAALAAQTNTIVVEGNYRLGLFGFMVSSGIVDGNSTGNYGILDQQLSLKWVHQNIRNFGGNPDDITIDGGSAGSASVYWHTLMPKSWPYYNRVIVSSAGYWRYSTLEDKVALTDKHLRSLNINCSDIVCLQNLNVSTLSQVPAIVYGLPVIDGVNLLDQPLLLFDAGRYKPNTSFIIGINKDEGTNLSEGFYDGITALLPTLTTSVILQELAVILNYNASLVPNVVSAYNFPQTYTTAVFNVSSAEFRSWIDFVGELIIDCGSIAAIKSLASQGTPVHAYYFDYVNDDPYSRLYGAYHSSEVEYKYNLTGNGNADQQKISATFVNYFEQYQLNSDPNPVVSRDIPRAWSNVGQNGLYWPLYNTSTNSTLIVNVTSTISPFPSYPRCSSFIDLILRNQYIDVASTATVSSSNTTSGQISTHANTTNVRTTTPRTTSSTTSTASYLSSSLAFCILSFWLFSL